MNQTARHRSAAAPDDRACGGRQFKRAEMKSIRTLTLLSSAALAEREPAAVRTDH
jgi:hypothetical protein